MSKKLDETDPLNTLVLTKEGARILDKYIEELIDIAADGNAGFAHWHRWDIENIFAKHSRKRPKQEFS